MASVGNLSKYCLYVFFGLQLIVNVSVNAKTLALTSLEWPPFAGESLPEQGVSIMIVRKALEAMGHELQVDFYPWNRAVRLAGFKGNKYVGYFPEYEYPTEEYVFSQPIGESPLGLIEHPDKPLIWQEERDLNRYTLGVVDGYINTDSIDKMIADSTQKAESVTSDIQNMRKVAIKRIDGAIIDLLVFNYLLDQANRPKMKQNLKTNGKILAIKQLYVAFNDSEEGKFWRETLNQGLNKIDIESLFEQYTTKYLTNPIK